MCEAGGRVFPPPAFLFLMSYATRKAATHGRIRSKFGTDADGAQLYVWHAGARITAYQSSGNRGRSILNQILVKDETMSVVATATEFTRAPVAGDEIKLGTTLTTARTLRLDSFRSKHGQPFYELELLDAKLATTAPES
jgi:hypothetical protein